MTGRRKGSRQPGQHTGGRFLSYAFRDAEAAKRICEALGAGGIEVWFDQSELRGGDAWDQSPPADQKLCAIYPAIRQLPPREEHKIWLLQPVTPA